MVYTISNFVFTYAMVVILSTYTFAPWVNQPIAPENGTIYNCYDWLIYHGFTDDYYNNHIVANERAREYDQYVFYFAAAFAFFLDNASELYNNGDIGPSEFCGLHTIPHVNYPYIALKDAEFTCEGWIDLYSYPENRDCKKDYNPNAHLNNLVWARKREAIMDNKIPLWPSLYFQYITDNRSSSELKTPREFCSLMGKPVFNMPLPKYFPFMTIDGSRMSCREWESVRRKSYMKENILAERNSVNVTKLPFKNLGIKCYELIIECGLSDDNSENYESIISEKVNVNNVNPFARNYINYVKKEHRNLEEYRNGITLHLQIEMLKLNHFKHEYKYIDQLSDDLENLKDASETMMAPNKFCTFRNFRDRELLNYLIFVEN